MGLQRAPSVHVLVQADCSVTVQMPPEVQQEPGCGQGFGEHDPDCDHEPVVHAFWSVMEQVPAAMQQTPGWAHGLGEHAPPRDHVASQADWSVRVQVPEDVQQVPGCGQELGEHVLPDMNDSPVGHGAAPRVHAPVVLWQQMPLSTTAMERLLTDGVSVLGVFCPQTPLELRSEEKVCAVASRTSMLSVRAARFVAV